MLCNGSNGSHRAEVLLNQKVLQFQKCVLKITVAVYCHSDRFCAASVYCFEFFSCISRKPSGKNRKCDNNEIIRRKSGDWLLQTVFFHMTGK